MTLRPRRNLVLWRQTARSPSRSPTAPVTRDSRIRTRIRTRIRRWSRRGRLLVLIGLMALGRGVLARWQLILAGGTLTVFGGLLHGGLGTAFLLPGLMLLISAPLLPGRSRAQTKLERELASYSTTADLRDLQATLDQYPDDTTRELREILASKAIAAHRIQAPTFGRR
ncbi:MAG TPA: hypothetical protein VIX15_06910 [Streptosporangiaceae bacterium]